MIRLFPSACLRLWKIALVDLEVHLSYDIETCLVYMDTSLEATDGHLTQIVYVEQEKRFEARWQWASCHIERIEN